MKLVTWLASDSEALFGTMDAPTGVKITALAHKEDASEYVGLSFEVTTPTVCTEITTVPADTFYNIYNPIDGYWLTDTLVRSAAKEMRTQETEVIIVTVDGMPFDGDELSQDRMTRAYVVLGDTGTMEWTLADNSSTLVTGAQLKQAITLAGQAQSALWAKYTL